jgi:hypothetical protein
MGKRAGKWRTVNARLKASRQAADKAGGVVCDACGATVAHDRATFVMTGGDSAAYCFACALDQDAGGFVQLLWASSEWEDGCPTCRSEGGREFVPPRYPGVLERDQG